MDYEMMIQERIKALLRNSEKLSFPHFASEKEKEKLLVAEKERVDRDIDLVCKNYKGIDEISREQCWENARQEAEEKFKTLPTKLRVNSFFFQEIMHLYIEKQYEVILRG